MGSEKEVRSEPRLIEKVEEFPRPKVVFGVGYLLPQIRTNLRKNYSAHLQIAAEQREVHLE